MPQFAAEAPRKFHRVGFGRTALSLYRGSLHEVLHREWRRQGDVAYFRIGSYDMVLLTDPRDVKHVLQDEAGRYGKSLTATEELLGRGISNAQGPHWRKHRMKLKSSFGHREMARLFPLTLHSARSAIADLRRRGHGSVDLMDSAVQLTQDIIFNTLFGPEADGERAGFLRAFEALVSNQVWMALMPSFTRGWPTPWSRGFHSAIGHINRFVMQRIARRGRDVESEACILDQLMAARTPAGEFLFSDEEVRDDLVSLMLAGYETTASTLSWLLTLVSQHPAVYRQLKSDSHPFRDMDALTYADLGRFHFGRAVIDEVMRLYPAGWSMRRIALCEDCLPSQVRIFPDDFLIISPYLLHRHPAHWSSPYEFRPDRFLDRERIRRKGYAYMPFGGGPRRCLGMNFAYMELLTMLLAFLNTGGWRIAAPAELPIHSRGALKPGMSLRLRFES